MILRDLIHLSKWATDYGLWPTAVVPTHAQRATHMRQPSRYNAVRWMSCSATGCLTYPTGRRSPWSATPSSCTSAYSYGVYSHARCAGIPRSARCACTWPLPWCHVLSVMMTMGGVPAQQSLTAEVGTLSLLSRCSGCTPYTFYCPLAWQDACAYT